MALEKEPRELLRTLQVALRPVGLQVQQPRRAA